MDYHVVEVVWRSSEVTEIEDLDQGFLQTCSMSFCVLFLSVNSIKTRYAEELLSISPDFPCIPSIKGSSGFAESFRLVVSSDSDRHATPTAIFS